MDKAIRAFIAVELSPAAVEDFLLPRQDLKLREQK
jgi:hypothetical protein